MGFYFLQTITLFVEPDVFLAGRSAYLIFIDDFFLSFLGNHLKQQIPSQGVTDALVFPMQEGIRKKVDNLIEWCCTQQN